MRTLIVAVMLLMLFSVGRAQEPLPVPIEPRAIQPMSQVLKLAPPDAGQFGYSIAVNGDTPGSILVVGAPSTMIYGISYAGAAFVYRMDETRNWQFWQKITAPDATEAHFGRAVDIAGTGTDTRIAVGAPLHDNAFSFADEGQAYIFRIQDGVWMVEAIFADPPIFNDPYADSPFDELGASVALTGTGNNMVLAIGEPEAGSYSTGASTGRVHLYSRTGTSWNYLTSLVPPDSGVGIGAHLDMIGSGNEALLAAGARGAVYIFDRPQGMWKPAQKLVSDQSSYYSGFGTDAAIAGPPGQRIIAVGAGGENTVYLYRHNGSEWTTTQKLPAVAPDPLRGFGYFVAVNGSASSATVFAGHLGYDSPGDSGRIIRYSVTPDAMTQLDILGPGDPYSETLFSREVAVPPDGAGNVVYGGRPFYSTGAIYMFGNAPGIQVTPSVLTIIEGSTGAQYSISVSAMPTANIIITADPAEGCDIGAGDGQPVTKTFTTGNWATPQNITVKAAPDAIPEAGVLCPITHSAFSIDPGYHEITISTVHVTVMDPPSLAAGIVVSGHQAVAVTEGGATDSYTLAIASEPTAAVQIHITPDAQCDVGAGAGQTMTLDFAVAQLAQTVTVAAADDTLNEGTHQCVITHSAGGATEYAGMVVPEVTATVTDNDAANLIANGDFESGVAPWTVRNKTGDKVLCDTATRSIAYAGSCAFRFKGGVGESAALVQNIDLTGIVFGQSDALRLQAMVSGGAAAKGKIKLRVLYANGEDTVVKLALPTTGAYALTEGAWLLLDSPDVQALTVTLQHKSTSGKVWVDQVALWHRPVIVLREVPAAVDGFRAP